MKIEWNFVGILGARGMRLTVGLAMMFVYARAFGVSATYDGWIWAVGIVNSAGMILFGPITETIRASYSSIESQEGQAAAEQYIATVAVMMIGGATFFAISAFVLIPELVTLLLPDSSEHLPSAYYFLYALAPSLALSQVVAVLTAHLNCRNKIYAPELAGIVGGGMGLAFIIAFPGLPEAWLLLGSYYLALLAPLVAGASFWPLLFAALSKLEWNAFRSHSLHALGFSTPLLLPYALGQILALVERQYALAAGIGALSVLSYAFFARNTVQAIFTAALSTLAVPTMARAWNVADTEPFRFSLIKWVQQCLMLATISMSVLFGFSDLIPSLLFGGNISVEHRALLGELLRFYAVAIAALVLFLVAGSGLLAARYAKTYAACSALACLVSLAFLFAFFPQIGVVAVPIAVAISHFLAASLMLRAIISVDASRLIAGAGARMLVIVLVGSAFHELDLAIAEQLGLVARSVAGALIAMMIATAWWAFEHWLGRNSERSVSTIEG